MKVERKVDFRPISLVLETPEEVNLVVDILRNLVNVGYPYSGCWSEIGKRFTIDKVMDLLVTIEEESG